MDISELIDHFSFLDDWQERYAYIIDLGRQLPPLDDALKTKDHLVKGCMSQVWLIGSTHPDGTLHWQADSDSAIVRGLVSMLLMLYSGKTPAQVLAIDIQSLFTELGLSEQLSPNRRNGFFSMVGLIRGKAEQLGRS